MSMKRDVKRANQALLAVGMTELMVARVWRDSAQITLWLSATHKADKKLVEQNADRLVGTVFGYSHVWEVRREGRDFVVTGGHVDKAELVKVQAEARAARVMVGQPPLADRIARVDVEGHLSEPGLGDWHTLPDRLRDRAPQLMSATEAVPFWQHAGLARETATSNGVLIDCPTLTAVRRERDGIAVALTMISGQTLPEWEKRLPQLRSLLHAPAMTVRQLNPHTIEMSWHDVQPAFPTAVAIALGHAVPTLDDARVAYTDWSVPLGADQYGDILTWTPRKQPHLFVVGSTGGGKSVFLRGLISSAALAGAAIWLGDGKGSDYPALRGLSGVQMVASTEADTVIMVSALRQEMQRRVNAAERAKSEGDASPYSAFSPILLVLDEFATVAARLQEHDKKGYALFQADIAELLRVGREPRVHVVLASQELRSDTIPGSWQENLRTIVSLGAPSEQTLRYGFPDGVRESAAEQAAMIPQGAKGRGLSVDADTGSVRLFQSFMQYSPGSTALSDAPTDDVRTAWEQTADALDALPQLHPRMAVSFDDPNYRDQSIGTLRDMSVVALDSRSGPRADRAHLDPASPSYTGRVAVSDSGGLGWADDPEPAQAVPLTKPTPPPQASPPPPAAKPAAPTTLADLFD